MSSLEKSPDAFRTISEVAEELDLPQHVLRFWETRFTQIKPLKRGGGRRYYRPDDVELLRGIRHLLYGEGYTIKGVQRILKDQGPRFVMQIWREDAMPVAVAHKLLEADAAPAPAARRPAVVEPQYQDHDPGSQDAPVQEPEALPRGVLAEGQTRAAAPAHGKGFRFIDRLRGEKAEQASEPGTLSKDDIRRLQATLFELLECKRLLDQAR
ncbi:MerR family transcriptional regulator [Polymorphum gilvum]|uniref:Probable transcriptional regulator protein, MerR family n=1 Tax=Polymorphum gilvum (strain LMG 25793 / CGMCC 1.9160 / SL003B-26A1) TaxID=991905 RepID=F2IWN2_POLGS|nr:MerR family transcriptional regulator [Polymorphum gilvum]ADZ70357.1 Probable transcriptional regulator protein, MerR family [Polymorphum gilvum SL003B-26A1]